MPHFEWWQPVLLGADIVILGLIAGAWVERLFLGRRGFHFGPLLPRTKSTEPIVAYRGWHDPGGLGLLASVGIGDYFWPARIAEPAQCKMNSTHRQTQTPRADCSCGYYARTKKEMLRIALDGIENGSQMHMIVGQASLWGRVIECETGYRAQYCYPRLLFGLERDKKRIRDLAQRYGVEYEIVADTEALAVRLGATALQIENAKRLYEANRTMRAAQAEYHQLMANIQGLQHNQQSMQAYIAANFTQQSLQNLYGQMMGQQPSGNHQPGCGCLTCFTVRPQP